MPDLSVLFETENFEVQVPIKPFVDRLEGGHLRIFSKLQVPDRTQLSRAQAIEYTMASMVAGEALKVGMFVRGVDIGIVNYQEMGNWMVFNPDGPTLHMHIFGRAKTAIVQKYGTAVLLPNRDTGFYDTFNPLDEDDIVAIRAIADELLKSEKYRNF